MSVDHERLTELFGEAMDLEPPARQSLLAALQRTDPTLAAELSALLAEDTRIVTQLRTAGLRPTDFGASTPPRAGGDLEVPIPGFRLGDRIGQGGMGVVYAAEQIAESREVAIKILFARSPEARGRFEAESAIMATLDHPGIARIYSAGEASGHPYIVMERIRGLTLDDHVRTHAPSRRQRFEIVAAVLDALHYAHTRGVVHRDLKPGNIMVREDGTVAVLDFGVARAAMLAGATRPGDFLGTPLYMSPEQAMGRADEVDARADIYSIGVTLFELVAGKAPFDLAGLALAASIRKILQHPVPALGADAVLDAIVARALAKQPAERYPTAASFAGDLRRYLARGL